MIPFLDETRLPKLSNHINYMTIEPEIRELWILEVGFWILFTVLTNMCYEGHNLPHTTLNWVQQILLGSWHIDDHA